MPALGWVGLLLITAAPPEPATLLEETFDADRLPAGWSRLGGGEVTVAGGALRVAQTDRAMTVATYDLPVERVAGRRLAWRVRVRADGVSEPAETWNGVKVMMVIARGERQNHPAPRARFGTHDWLWYEYLTRVPADATRVTLYLGLQDSSGAVWFDDLTVATGRPPWAAPEGFVRPEAPFRGHSLPRGRGFMVGPRYRESDWRDLGEDWNVNLVRWQMNWSPMTDAEEWAADIERYDAWLEEQLAETDQALAAAERYGILVLVDLHTPPGGRREGGHCRLFDEARYQEHFLRIWETIARRYAGRDIIWAYDLVNEPVQTTMQPGLDDWRTLATRAVDVIRAIDPGKPVVVEPTPWGGPDGFDSFAPLARPDIIYSCHMYQPHHFTHQTIHGLPGGLVYPGEVGGAYWDKDRLREALRPAIEFSHDFGVAMYIGEFSAVRWAPDNSAYRYLRDLIEIFEEQGWDWAYHAFREFHGWSAEHSTVQDELRPPVEPTEREQLLRSWFAQNVKIDR